MTELDLNDPVVLANLPGKDIYGVPVGNLVSAIESAAERIESLETTTRLLTKQVEEQHSRIVELGESLSRSKEREAAEHDLYLTAHRDNMKGAALLMEREADLAAANSHLDMEREHLKIVEAKVQALTRENAEQRAKLDTMSKGFDASCQSEDDRRENIKALDVRERDSAKTIDDFLAGRTQPLTPALERLIAWADAKSARERELVKELEAKK